MTDRFLKVIMKTQIELPVLAKLIWSIPGGKYLFFILVGIAVIAKEFLRDKKKVLLVNKIILAIYLYLKNQFNELIKKGTCDYKKGELWN